MNECIFNEIIVKWINKKFILLVRILYVLLAFQIGCAQTSELDKMTEALIFNLECQKF